MMEASTIIQLATPRVLSAIHIIRISGPDSLSFLKRHTQLSKVLPRKVYCTTFLDQGTTIDRLICFYFKSPHSYTGEDLVELQCHGSLLIVDQILKIAIREDFKLAQPGEFTFRSFLNGKINLEESEAIDALIRSNSEQQKKNALKILENKASLKFKDIYKQLLDILAELESSIEFPEEDIPEIDFNQPQRYQHYLDQCLQLKTYFESIHINYQKGKKIESGINLVLIGRPNSGKSTLMNLLLRENRAITSDQKGTTRDYLSECWQLDQFLIRIFDTAGLHKTKQEIEQQGIKKSIELIEVADMIIWLITDDEGLEEIQKLLPPEKKTLVFLNKSDLHDDKKLSSLQQAVQEKHLSLDGIISLKQGNSLKLIETKIKDYLLDHYSFDREELALLNERQAVIVKKVLKRQEIIIDLLRRLENEEVLMEEFSQLTDYLQEINLNLDHEKIFDHLFSRFCLGK